VGAPCRTQAFPPNGIARGLQLGHGHADWVIQRYGEKRARSKHVDGEKQEMSRNQLASVQYIFKEYDEDGSGAIDYKEFRRALAKMKHPIAMDDDQQKITELLKTIDKNNSGFIEFEEFLAFVAEDMGVKPPGAYDEETLDKVIERGCDHTALEDEAELQQRAQQELQSGVDEEQTWDEDDTVLYRTETAMRHVHAELKVLRALSTPN